MVTEIGEIGGWLNPSEDFPLPEVHLFPRDGRAGGALPHHVPWLRGWLGRRRLHRPAGAAEVWSLGNASDDGI